jgi:hypothetical protein
VTRGAPPWARAAGASLRKPVASLRWSWVRLAVWLAAPAAVYLWASADPRWWVPVVLAAVPSVLLSPMLLLAVERITRPGDKTRETRHAAPRR